MPLKVVLPNSSTWPIYSPEDFERALNVRYLDQLEFNNASLRLTLEKKVQKALLKEWITPKQRWLGHYFAQGIRGDVSLDLTIAWINDAIGYGVWTNSDIEAKTFIGEYTGLIRRRRFWRRWKNRYCFDYTIGPYRSTSMVIDCQDCGNHTRFINHSAHPNLDLTSVYCDGMIHVILTANKLIPAGTQLCYDYGADYWEKRGKPLILSE